MPLTAIQILYSYKLISWSSFCANSMRQTMQYNVYTNLSVSLSKAFLFFLSLSIPSCLIMSKKVYNMIQKLSTGNLVNQNQLIQIKLGYLHFFKSFNSVGFQLHETWYRRRLVPGYMIHAGVRKNPTLWERGSVPYHASEVNTYLFNFFYTFYLTLNTIFENLAVKIKNIFRSYGKCLFRRNRPKRR